MPPVSHEFSALEIFRNAAATSPSGIRGLTDVEGSAQEVRRVAADVWSALGISGPPDGWQLPVAAAHVEDLAASTGLARDDLIRATHICWTGCPECVDRGDLVMGEPMARNYIDKLLLDTWFMDGIARSQDTRS